MFVCSHDQLLACLFGACVKEVPVTLGAPAHDNSPQESSTRSVATGTTLRGGQRRPLPFRIGLWAIHPNRLCLLPHPPVTATEMHSATAKGVPAGYPRRYRTTQLRARGARAAWVIRSTRARRGSSLHQGWDQRWLRHRSDRRRNAGGGVVDESGDYCGGDVGEETLLVCRVPTIDRIDCRRS